MSRAAAKTSKTDDRPEALDELLLIRELERFVTAELELLDGREFEAWRDLFTEDGRYWVPSRVDQESPEDELSLFYDDREIMDLRIRRLRHPRVHAQIPHTRTSHVVGNFALTSTDHENGAYAFRCRFVPRRRSARSAAATTIRSCAPARASRSGPRRRRSSTATTSTSPSRSRFDVPADRRPAVLTAIPRAAMVARASPPRSSEKRP